MKTYTIQLEEDLVEFLIAWMDRVLDEIPEVGKDIFTAKAVRMVAVLKARQQEEEEMEYKTVIGFGYRDFLEEIELLPRYGWKPLFPHTVTLVPESEQTNDPEPIMFYFSQQWYKPKK